MPDWKKQWPELLYKVLMAVFAVLLGYNQYQGKQVHQDLNHKIEKLQEHVKSNH
jgi:predicted negative regulator of RcsB-dependent stress response